MDERGKHPDGPTIHIFVNGDVRLVPVGMTVGVLVVQVLGCQPTQVAVERNKGIVRRAEYATTSLADGDHLEVVTFFGGG